MLKGGSSRTPRACARKQIARFAGRGITLLAPAFPFFGAVHAEQRLAADPRVRDASRLYQDGRAAAQVRDFGAPFRCTSRRSGSEKRFWDLN